MSNCFYTFLHKLEPIRFKKKIIHTVLVGRTISRILKDILIYTLYIYIVLCAGFGFFRVSIYLEDCYFPFGKLLSDNAFIV